MVLIRLAHAVDLPTLDETIKSLEATAQIVGPAPIAGPQGGSSGPTSLLKSIAGSGGSAQRATPDPIIRQVPSALSTAPVVSIASLADIADLAEKRRDIHFKIQFRKYVSLVKLEQGRLDINLSEGAPRTLAGDISKRLLEWTGQRWMVSVSADTGSATLDDIDNQRRTGLFNDARADPDVAAIFAKFPGAKIIDVKITGATDNADAVEIDTPAIENTAPDDEIDDN
jgi:DNA polymerase-3 subunit gamma/tau